MSGPPSETLVSGDGEATGQQQQMIINMPRLTEPLENILGQANNVGVAEIMAGSLSSAPTSISSAAIASGPKTGSTGPPPISNLSITSPQQSLQNVYQMQQQVSSQIKAPIQQPLNQPYQPQPSQVINNPHHPVISPGSMMSVIPPPAPAPQVPYTPVILPQAPHGMHPQPQPLPSSSQQQAPKKRPTYSPALLNHMGDSDKVLQALVLDWLYRKRYTQTAEAFASETEMSMDLCKSIVEVLNVVSQQLPTVPGRLSAGTVAPQASIPQQQGISQQSMPSQASMPPQAAVGSSTGSMVLARGFLYCWWAPFWDLFYARSVIGNSSINNAAPPVHALSPAPQAYPYPQLYPQQQQIPPPTQQHMPQPPQPLPPQQQQVPQSQQQIQKLPAAAVRQLQEFLVRDPTTLTAEEVVSILLSIDTNCAI